MIVARRTERDCRDITLKLYVARRAATRIRIVIRRLFLLLALLVALGFGAGVYVGLIKTRWMSSAPGPAAANAPVAPAPRATPEAKRAEPSAPPVERPMRRAPAPKPEPEPATPPPASKSVGLLSIDSDVPGAQVFIDREFVGTAPVRAHEVAPGSHKVNVSAPGFEGVAETIDVVPGPRELVIKLREVRLDSEIEVIHKHRMGACNGRLIATAQGMRYETRNENDRFDVALADFDTLEVDYLKKNLRLKVKKGRTFDFADPEGNADHLFVFHRDVVKARERLMKGDPPATP